MANLTELNQFDAGIYQLETTDPVLGGAGGIANAQAKALANRTQYLKNQVELRAPIASPAFTGSPTVAASPAAGDKSTKLATTEFVAGLVNGILNKSVAGGVDVTLTAAEAGNGVYIFTGQLTANINVIVPAAGNHFLVVNRTTGAFALTVKAAGQTGGVVVAQAKQSELACDGSNVILAQTDFAELKFASGFAASLSGAGYQKLPSGLILQWGNGSTDNAGGQNVVFPIAFPTVVLNFSATYVQGGAAPHAFVGCGQASLTGMVLRCATSADAYSGGVVSTHWMAIGY